MLARDHRLPGGEPAAQLGRAGRARGPARHPQVPREPRRGAARRVPHPRERARDEPRVGGRWRGCASSSWRATRRDTSSSPTSRPRRRSTRSDLAALMVTYPSTYGDLRGRDRAHLRDRPRARRAGVPRRREPQRAGRPLPPGRRGRRRLPREPAQDVLHPPRRRRPRHGPHRRGAAPREVPAAAPGRPGRRRRGDRRRQRGALGQREHPAHLVGVHRDDGPRRAEARERARHPQRELRGRPAARRTSRCSTGASAGAWRTSASSTRAASSAPRASRSTTSPSA